MTVKPKRQPTEVQAEESALPESPAPMPALVNDVESLIRKAIPDIPGAMLADLLIDLRTRGIATLEDLQALSPDAATYHLSAALYIVINGAALNIYAAALNGQPPAQDDREVYGFNMAALYPDVNMTFVNRFRSECSRQHLRSVRDMANRSAPAYLALAIRYALQSTETGVDGFLILATLEDRKE